MNQLDKDFEVDGESSLGHLPLNHLLKDQGIETSGANSFTGKFGHPIKDKVHGYEANDEVAFLDY